MEFYQLQCFYEAAKEQNITRAAQKLNVTQPALSKTINRLEEDLGVSLFDRHAKTITLNEYGRSVMERAEAIFSCMEDIRSGIRDIRDGTVGTIRIGSTLPSSENSRLLHCIRDFMMENPKVCVSQHQMDPEHLLTAVLEGEVDMAVGGDSLMLPELEWKELYSRRLGLAAATDGRFSGVTELSVTELSDGTFFCNNTNADMEKRTLDICRRAGFEPNIALVSNYSNLIGELVSLDRGICLIPEAVFRNREMTGDPVWSDRIRLISLKEEYCVLRGVVAVSGSRYVSNAARRLYRRITETVRE